jgi:hypothetical protein
MWERRLKTKFLIDIAKERQREINIVIFQVFTGASMKMTAFWDVVPCSLRNKRFIALMMEAVCTSETSVYFITLMMGTVRISEASVNFHRLHCTTSQEGAIFKYCEY